MSRNIAAFTEPGPCMPDYISINEEPDGAVTVTTRVFTSTSSITVTGEQFKAMADQIAEWRARK